MTRLARALVGWAFTNEVRWLWASNRDQQNVRCLRLMGLPGSGPGLRNGPVGHSCDSAQTEQARVALGWPTLDVMSQLQLPDPPLTHERVLLRPWRQADVPQNLMAFTDPVVPAVLVAHRPRCSPSRTHVATSSLRSRRGCGGRKCSLPWSSRESRTRCWVVPRSPALTVSRQRPWSGTGLGHRLAAEELRPPPSGCSPRGVSHAGAGSDRADVCPRQRRLRGGRGTLRVRP